MLRFALPQRGFLFCPFPGKTKDRRVLMPGGLSYERRIKNDLRRSVQDGLLGLDVEEMDLVGIEGNADLVSVACL